VLFTCDTDRAIRLDTIAIKILNKFEQRVCLCVGQANAGMDGRGRISRSPRSVIHMICGKVDRTNSGKPGREIIKEVASEVLKEVSGMVTRSQLEGGLMVLKRLTERAQLTWIRP
jgi:hypothetical protein